MGSIEKIEILGRVSLDKLEDKVPDDWWTLLFNDPCYFLTDGDVVEDPEITREEVRLLESYESIKRIFKTPGARILDLCCGQGRHAILLAEMYPHLKIYGHDNSTVLIQLAEQRAGDHNLINEPFFTLGDARSIPYPSDFFDLIIVMGNSFGYFREMAENVKVLTEMRRVGKSATGIIVLDNTDGEYTRANYSPMSWEWLDDERYVTRERTISRNGSRLICRERITHVSQGMVKDWVFAEWLFTESHFWELLNPLGISKVEEGQTEITTGKDMSVKKDQDMGMMAHRVLVVGRCN